MANYEDRKQQKSNLYAVGDANLPCEYAVSGSTLTLTEGIRKTPNGYVVIPSRTINTPFSNFDDDSEATTGDGFKYFYAELLNPSLIAISNNSPYDKNGGISNVVSISGSNWVYIGAAKYQGGSWISARSKGNTIHYRQESIGAANSGGTGWRLLYQTSAHNNTLTYSNLFGNAIPGSTTNERSKVAVQARFGCGAQQKHRSDGGTNESSYLDMNIFGQRFHHSRIHQVKTPQGGNYYPVDEQFFNADVSTLDGTDTLTTLHHANSAVGDGNLRVGAGIINYVDQYILY